MMSQRINQPASPGSFAIPMALTHGTEITFNGTVHSSKKDFTINLLAGSNTALQVDFRWKNDKIVVLNAKIDNVWGNELRHDNPLHHGQTFELNVRVYPTYYHVTVNGVLLGDFPHRVAYQSVNAIFLDGHVNMHFVNFTRF
ncbi:unnamed protein product [Caenorhabditis bovis]|uniref:Galectin n=1 Tax=Caenorhabditis bovis TaxID=2654633 RepID=A0A8S1ECX4_9PELO|nr:unnamed protein product [Caenorhabditis bovis]